MRNMRNKIGMLALRLVVACNIFINNITNAIYITMLIALELALCLMIFMLLIIARSFFRFCCVYTFSFISCFMCHCIAQ